MVTFRVIALAFLREETDGKTDEKGLKGIGDEGVHVECVKQQDAIAVQAYAVLKAKTRTGIE